jgi:hypothetical protein
MKGRLSDAGYLIALINMQKTTEERSQFSRKPG